MVEGHSLRPDSGRCRHCDRCTAHTLTAVNQIKSYENRYDAIAPKHMYYSIPAFLNRTSGTIKCLLLYINICCCANPTLCFNALTWRMWSNSTPTLLFSRSCITTCGSVLEVGLNGLEENDVSSGNVYSLESVRRLQFSPQGFPISHNNQIREIMKHI